MEKDKIKKAVRDGYAQVAKQSNASCCGPVNSGCGCGTGTFDVSKSIGYTDDDIKTVPEGANLGLGCGNPIALASLREGEVVLDLGSGAGFDSFLAAKKVGAGGGVIGVDMTPEMVEKARENARKGEYENVEFRLGEIENLPVADNSVDVITSNCVINLSPDKERVFKEAFRVLKPGGRLMISDIVLEKELPDYVKNSTESYVGCISGAILRSEYLETIKSAGFEGVRVVKGLKMPAEAWVTSPIAESAMRELNIPLEGVKDVLGSVESIQVQAVKPRREG